MGISQVVLLTVSTHSVSTVHPIPSHPIMYPNVPGTEWEHPKLYHPPSAFLLSIPSQCTIGRKGWSGNIPNCTTPYACIPTVHPIPMYHRKEGTEWEHPKLYHPLCLHPYCPSHPNVPWEGRDRVGTSQTVPPTICIPTVHPIPMYHGKEGTEWELPKLYHPPSASLLSIPSQCTMGRKGWSGNIPNCTTSHVCIPTVHPIPMYHRKEGMEWEHPKLYHPLCLHPYCPSHPNVPWEGRDRVGTSQTVPPTICIPTVHPIPMYHGKEGMEWEHPKLYHLSCLHSYCPSHPNVPQEEGMEWEHPNCTTPYACIPTVHPIPMYHGKEGMEWEHPKLYHPLCLHPYCPSHPNVPWEGRDRVGTSKLYHPPSASLLSIPSQCTMGRKGWSGNIPNVPWEGRDRVGTSQTVQPLMSAFLLLRIQKGQREQRSCALSVH